MKIAVIGGASVRTPLLVRGLVASGLPFDDVALYDVDQERLALMAPLVQRLAPNARVRPQAAVADCVTGARFVFTSIRVGGAEARARYERVAIDHGVVGQETVGAGGFAMAMAAIPAMVACARQVAEHAPDAWIVNFTNPVGIITEAVTKATGARILGICDTPTELFEEIAHALGLPSAECHFDYFGLNHLGWVREVRHKGVPKLSPLFEDDARLTKLYRTALFPPSFLRGLRLLPTEYLFFYYSPERALQNLKAVGQSRGEAIQRMSDRLFATLRANPSDPAAVYDSYIAERNGSYLQLESGSATPLALSPAAAVTGYDKIAIAVVRAILDNTASVIPLSVPNRGNIPELRDDDVVEIPCAITANGALPLHVGKLPETARDLLVRVKEYERLTVEAALSGKKDAAVHALSRNPLVDDAALAERLVAALA